MLHLGSKTSRRFFFNLAVLLPETTTGYATFSNVALPRTPSYSEHTVPFHNQVTYDRLP